MINNSNENILLDDANSPDVDRKVLGIVSSDFIKVSDHLKEASYQIRKRGFSEFPIFVLARNEVAVGQILFAKNDFETQYDYKASFLQEFMERGLVSEESVVFFKEHYRNADEYCCLFVLEGEFANFVFMPYPED